MCSIQGANEETLPDLNVGFGSEMEKCRKKSNSKPPKEETAITKFGVASSSLVFKRLLASSAELDSSDF